MPGPMHSLMQSLRHTWASLTGADEPAQHPEVIVHDPAAQAPHDLDDPFFDSQVQSRVADLIASAGQKK